MSESQTIVGIDPGLTGAIVELTPKGNILSKHVMPTVDKKLLDLKQLRVILSLYKNSMVYLEKVHSMPKQGVASSFKFGRVFGVLEGMLAALQIPYKLVTPQRWQKKMHEGIEREIGPKERSLMAVTRLYPNEDLRATERSKTPHKGLVDALLIARYGLEEE